MSGLHWLASRFSPCIMATNRETANMGEKPVWIEQFERPAGTEIKHIGNHWYLYERLSVHDRGRKGKRKKSGRCLGAISPRRG